MSSPPGKSPPTYHIADLKGFLPLSQETSLSTRGQKLPGLLQTRSHSSLADLPTLKRRQTSNDLAPSRLGQGQERDSDVESQQGGGRGREGDDRKSSLAVLMTPQMRTQRLIGNSNPRYKWYAWKGLYVAERVWVDCQ